MTFLCGKTYQAGENLPGYVVRFSLAPLRSRGRGIGALSDYAQAFFKSMGEMRRGRPRVAVAFGSYASVPPALAALSLRIPLVIHEQNVVPGRANRLLARWATRCALSFPETLSWSPSWRKKAVVTGNPLLRPPGKETREEALKHFDLEDERFTLGVVGGSQGARTLNRAVREALLLWKERNDLQVVHSVGERDYEEMSNFASEAIGKILYRPFPYVARMDLLYRVSDLMICRAGASTVAELAAYGCASILVPYPYAGGHQAENARVLAEAGAAVICWDEEFSGRKLREMVEELMADRSRLMEMRRRAAERGIPDAASALARLVLEVAKGGSP